MSPFWMQDFFGINFFNVVKTSLSENDSLSRLEKLWKRKIPRNLDEKNEENIIPLFLTETFQEKLKYFFSLSLSRPHSDNKNKKILSNKYYSNFFVVLKNFLFLSMCDSVGHSSYHSTLFILYLEFFFSKVPKLWNDELQFFRLRTFFFLSRKKILTHFRRKSRGGTWCSEWARNLYPTIIFPFLKDEKCRYFLFCEKYKTFERTSFIFWGVSQASLVVRL